MRDRPLFNTCFFPVCISVLLQLAHLLTKCLPQFTGPSFQQVECPHPGAILHPNINQNLPSMGFRRHRSDRKTNATWLHCAIFTLYAFELCLGEAQCLEIFDGIYHLWCISIRLKVIKWISDWSSKAWRSGCQNVSNLRMNCCSTFHLFHCQDTSKLATWALSAVFSESLLDFQAFKVSSSWCVSNLSLITEITWKNHIACYFSW